MAVTGRLTSYCLGRNLTGNPQTYALPGLFMAIIDKLADLAGDAVVSTTAKELADVSSSDEEVRKRLEGPIYVENTDVARFELATLAEDAMTKETKTDL